MSSAQTSVCVDEPNWVVGGSSGFAGLGCSVIDLLWCDIIEGESDGICNDKTINEDRCASGGSVFKSVAPSGGGYGFSKTSTIPSVSPSAESITCSDQPGWRVELNGIEATCDFFTNPPLCNAGNAFYSDGENALTACCSFGGHGKTLVPGRGGGAHR